MLFDEFCISVATGDDFVSRLSRHCMDLLKHDLKRILHTCHIPKRRIFRSVIFHVCSGPSLKTRKLRDKTINKEELERIRIQTQSLPTEWKLGCPDEPAVSTAPQTYMPGRVLYLEKIRDFGNYYGLLPPKPTDGPTRRANATIRAFRSKIETGIQKVKDSVKEGKYVYVPRWGKRHEFQQVIVSRSMLNDHWPFPFLKQFEEAPDGMPLRTTS